jgi:hypothetical protein
MRTARTKRRKGNFTKKIKSFFIYSFVSIVVRGFFLNTFISNLLEYSFALADSGGIVDLKTDEKYSVALISTNKLDEVKKVNLVTYDKKNRRMTNFEIDRSLEIESNNKIYKLNELLTTNKNSTSEDINKILQSNFGTNLAFTYITSSDDFNLIEKVVLGKGSIYDLYLLKEMKEVSLRDLYFIYSFAGSIDSKDKKDIRISNQNELDKEIKDIYIDSELGLESPAITIINSTNTNGLGKKYTRFVTNLGGRVIDTANGDEVLDESMIIYKDKSSSVSYLSTKLAISKSLSMEEVGLKYPEIIKSDLVVVLGIDKVE